MLLVDSDILIEFSRGSEQAIYFLQQASQSETLAVSTITAMEFLIGAKNKTELQNLEQLLAQFVVVKLNDAISDRALELIRSYRLSHGLQLPDALIAATALVIDESFATRNQRDYRFIAGLKLQSYS